MLDTSGSMNHELLGKALGVIASYAIARDVPAARVVFCDAHPYDAGYLPVEQIAGRVRVRGRGGTVLQPGIHLLETAPDFPTAAPILLITDGHCDVVRIRREHAFLIPEAARLPFTPRGPVFRHVGERLQVLVAGVPLLQLAAEAEAGEQHFGVVPVDAHRRRHLAQFLLDHPLDQRSLDAGDLGRGDAGRVLHVSSCVGGFAGGLVGRHAMETPAGPRM
ncbi:hypothetical protein [Micromonospora pallida]|uniref:hypothetical protein n=1 Tax=Micromonospora pallida TaxID=145854 RepID=UPI001FDF156F|nr:hypothetical protein [Micromonospora pallida]